MPRVRDPAREARDRLLRLEQRAKAREEGQAVAEGVAETVALSRARGSAIEAPAAGPGRGAYRRQEGLAWLARKGRITAAARAAGERYGWAYRRAKLEGSIRSTLDVRPGGGFAGAPPLEAVLAHGEGTELARRKLAQFRARLLRQPDLVAACDLICGEEKTPREATGDEREALRLEAVLKVALDILAGEEGR
ncbi:MAG: hypothetical protein JF588_03620 [Caulobacterales bacterium]|nr:hypothetical protein [Caulobacterales bacterium]